MAKRFVFRLETVQRVRALREREAQRKVAAKRAEIARLDELNRAAAADIRREQERLVGEQRGAAVDPRGLARGRAWVTHLRTTILQREEQKRARLAELEELQDAWRETRKQLKVIEKLRERRVAAHRAEQHKREQADMDEVAQRLHWYGDGPLRGQAADALGSQG